MQKVNDIKQNGLGVGTNSENLSIIKSNDSNLRLQEQGFNNFGIDTIGKQLRERAVTKGNSVDQKYNEKAYLAFNLDLPKEAEKAIECVSKFAQGDQDVLNPNDLGYFNTGGGEAKKQQVLGIYRRSGRCMLNVPNFMDEQHRNVFKAVLNAVCDKNEAVQRAILLPIAKNIIESVEDSTNLQNDATHGSIEVDEVIRDFFSRLASLLKENELGDHDYYLLYTVENTEEGNMFWRYQYHSLMERVKVRDAEKAAKSAEATTNSLFKFCIILILLAVIYRLHTQV